MGNQEFLFFLNLKSQGREKWDILVVEIKCIKLSCPNNLLSLDGPVPSQLLFQIFLIFA
jgi:hypothetical protein